MRPTAKALAARQARTAYVHVHVPRPARIVLLEVSSVARDDPEDSLRRDNLPRLDVGGPPAALARPPAPLPPAKGYFMRSLRQPPAPWRRGRRGGAVSAVLGSLALVVVVVLLMLWLVGGFGERIKPGAAAASTPPVDGDVVAATLVTLPRIEAAVGTVQPVHRVEVAARILSRVVEINASAGQKVARDEMLVRLDDADLTARLRQAEAALAQAVAERDQAQIEHDRTRSLFEQNTATPLEMARDETALKSAEAAVRRGEQAVAETQTVLSFATVRSPIDGVVVDKRVNVGDTATPGQVLIALHDPTRMQLVAPVREAFSRRLRPGQQIDVSLDVLEHACPGTISEIVPEADPASRSFSVKVTGPCPEGVYAGMFGRLLIPLDPEEVLTIPAAAVRSVGQLDVAVVRTPAGDLRRTLRLGRTLGDDVEVLAGLAPGEQVIVPSLEPGD